MPLTGQPFATTQPWSSEAVMDVMRSIVSDTEDDIRETVGEQLLTQLMLFLHRLSIRIADEVFDDSLEEQYDDAGEKRDSFSPIPTEEEMDGMAEKLTRHFENPDFVTWMFQFIGGFGERLSTQALEIAELLGINMKGIIHALVDGESIMLHAPCRLGNDAVDRLSAIGVDVYENMIYEAGLHFARPSEMAIHIWKQADGPEKTEDDIEDESLVESYITTHPTEVMAMEKEEFHRILKETLEEYKDDLDRFVTTYGPKYIELLVTRSILPRLDEGLS